MSIRKIFVALLLGLVTMVANAGVDVRAKLDSVYIEMGRMTTLHLSVSQPKNTRGTLTLLKEIRENGIIPVCGDSVEFRAPSKIDTVVNGDNVTINYEIPVQAFDSGYYQLPELLYVVGNDTSRSKSLSLKVIPVKAEADTPIADYASTADPADSSIFDYLPDWLVDFWWVILIVLLLAAATYYFLRKYRKEGHILPKKPEPTPYEAAIKAMRDLKEKKLWEQGMEKEYYSDLTEILRKYLDGRFGINAMEMTSRQILHALSANKEISDKRITIRQILDMADFVKFAKVRPLPEDNIKTYDYALQFVKDTKPQPKAVEEVVGAANTPLPKKGKKGGAK